MAANNDPVIVFIMPTSIALKAAYTKYAKTVEATAVFFEPSVTPPDVHRATLGVYNVLLTVRPDMVKGLRDLGHRNYIVGLLKDDKKPAMETERRAFNAAQANEVVGEFLTQKTISELLERSE
ncbi:unnamed protein product [Microthlaspi erraticum]|uniref:Uncharacterized protein n=1 Tax=Microthlaspi erraticum TaxID=1685480 RepID=A0A6D2JJ67_9BRAS|nr:unnamed protein product [Microthlaspi erraticum]